MNESNFKSLEIWQLSMDLVEDAYKLAWRLPREEIYGLSDQIRRCAESVPANIAEGHGRGSDKEFKQFLHYSRGSLCELETHFLAAKRVGYFREEDIASIISKCQLIGRKIKALIKALK